MLRKILLVLLVLVAALVIVIATRPNTFRYERSATINAPAAVVFDQVNNLHNWEAWSPWAKLDPNSKVTYEGPVSGEGAVFNWAGNKDVGEGRMTIVESRPSELVKIKLEFFKPFAATNTSEFTFQPQGNQTSVTWAMYGSNNFMSKAMSLVMDCDKMLGGFFEKGLAQLNTVSQAKATSQPAPTPVSAP